MINLILKSFDKSPETFSETFAIVNSFQDLCFIRLQWVFTVLTN